MLHYPKLLLLAACIVLAYALSHVGAFEWLTGMLNGHGYVSVLLGGLLFSFGFTSPFAVAIFVETASQVHPVSAAILGGAAAFLSDFLLFEFARCSFYDELSRLRMTRMMQWAHGRLHRETVSERFRKTLLWSVAGLVIASPLPDEIGVTLLSSVTTIDAKRFALLSFSFNTLGILCIFLGVGLLA